MAEELWERLGHPSSLARAPWPAHDPKALETDAIVLVVQVNGKVRAKLTVPSRSSDEQVKQAALSDAQVKKHLDGRPAKQVIVVPKRLVNIVV